MIRELTLNVNGRDYTLAVKSHHTLLQVLRDQLNVLSAREGCGVGMCGSCTVLIDGKPVSGCLTLAVQAAGKRIQTVEGLSRDGNIHPIQQAFVEATGFQCSFCTPGFILATQALLEEIPDAGDDEIREYLAGNLCRCGSYYKILEAVKLARERLRSTRQE